MKAICEDINGLYVIYRIDGKRYIDDSTFGEIMNIKKGDTVELTEERFKELGEMEGEK